MSTAYLISMIVFDTEHQRSNLFHHSGFVLMKGDKDQSGAITNLEALGSYGFYTHQIPKDVEITKIKKKLGLVLRWQGSYAEFKEEDLKTVDLGFGVKTSLPLEISSDEKDRLMAVIDNQFLQQRTFFKQPDADALADVQKTFPDFNPDNKESKNNKAAMKALQLATIYHREAAYLQACADVDFEGCDMLDKIAIDTGSVTDERARQDRVKDMHGVHLFNFDVGAKASTCKILILDFLIDALRGSVTAQSDSRIDLLSRYKSGFYSGPFPRFQADSETAIFDTRQAAYTAKPGSVAIPAREWSDVKKGEAVCKLQFLAEQKYMSVTGTLKQLNNDVGLDASKVLQVLNENLSLMKRMLNSLILLKPGFKDLIQFSLTSIIDVALDKMLSIKTDKQTLDKTLAVYQGALTKLYQNGALDILLKAASDKNVKFELGVEVELPRLSGIVAQAKKTSELKIADVMAAPQNEQRPNQRLSIFNRQSHAATDSATQPVGKFQQSFMCIK